MSTTSPPAAPAAGVPAPALAQGPQEIRLYGHSTLFYWWPVWALGFIMTLISLIDNTRIIHVPVNTAIAEVSPDSGEYKVANTEHKEKMQHLMAPYTTNKPDEVRRPPRVDDRAWMGATFCIVLLLVISITNVPLRGLWSVVVIVTIILMSVIFALAGWWDDIFHALGGLHIFIGMAGYLFIATVLFIMWIVAMFLFDRQIYIAFEPGQMKVVEEVGGGEKAYDTAGMSVEKHRDDLFRHWVLGLGSGDLTVRTSGATPHQVMLSNVLFISTKLQAIEMMQREKQIRVD
jgi:hypothetical protein